MLNIRNLVLAISIIGGNTIPVVPHEVVTEVEYIDYEPVNVVIVGKNSYKNSNEVNLDTGTTSSTQYLHRIGEIITTINPINDSNYLLLDGHSIMKTSYLELYTLFGANKYGTDTSSTFYLPNLMDRYLIGSGGTLVGKDNTTSLINSGQLVGEQLPNITGSLKQKSYTNGTPLAWTTSESNNVYSVSGVADGNNWGVNFISGSGINSTLTDIIFNAHYSSDIYTTGGNVRPYSYGVYYYMIGKDIPIISNTTISGSGGASGDIIVNGNTYHTPTIIGGISTIDTTTYPNSLYNLLKNNLMVVFGDMSQFKLRFSTPQNDIIEYDIFYMFYWSCIVWAFVFVFMILPFRILKKGVKGRKPRV